jgi:hypothetical protein
MAGVWGQQQEGRIMQHVRDGYRGLSVFFGLNADRFLSAAVIALTMMLAIWIYSV